MSDGGLPSPPPTSPIRLALLYSYTSMNLKRRAPVTKGSLTHARKSIAGRVIWQSEDHLMNATKTTWITDNASGRVRGYAIKGKTELIGNDINAYGEM